MRSGSRSSDGRVAHSFAFLGNEWGAEDARRERNRYANEWATLDHFWQKRFYDFNVWSEAKRKEKIRYIHGNPVRRGLVSEPDQWPWSSFRSYVYREPGLVRVNSHEWPLEIKALPRKSFAQGKVMNAPLIRTERE